MFLNRGDIYHRLKMGPNTNFPLTIEASETNEASETTIRLIIIYAYLNWCVSYWYLHCNYYLICVECHKFKKKFDIMVNVWKIYWYPKKPVSEASHAKNTILNKWVKKLTCDKSTISAA